MRGGSVSVERVFVQARAAGTHGVPAVGGAGRGEAGADGVVEDVVDGGREIGVGVDQARGEAVAPEVPGARVLAVEALGVEAVEAAEPVGERLAGAGEDDVHVIRHQAEREDAPAVAGGDVAKERQEAEVVGVVAKHGAAVDASRGDVVDAVGEEAARGAGHASTVRPGGRRGPLWGRFATLLARSTWPLGPRTRDSP
jgi:hypothetical protein